MKASYFEDILNGCNLTLIFTVVFLLLSIVFYKLKNRNTPPGPWGLPFVGYWPFLNNSNNEISLQFEELRRKYGDIFSFTVTGQLYIHLGSTKAIREAHVTKSDYFMDRKTGFRTFTCFFPEGFFGENGEKWKTLRKFFIQKFREYGISTGKDMSGSIADAIDATMETFRAANGAPIDFISVLSQQCSTVLRRMLFNDDCISNEELKELIDNYDKVVGIFADKRIFLAGNVAKYVILPFNSSFQESTRKYKKIEVILKKVINRHKETFNEKSVRNVLDSYYKERDERKSKNDSTAEFFTDQALASAMLQFLGDGILGLAAYFSYYVRALIEYPEEQEKIFNELEEVLGPDNQPALEDRNRLPYLNAFMLEVARTSDFITHLLSLECTKETTVGGYRIPQGAVTLMNFWMSHRDSRIYDEPDKFKPSRFLKEPGKEREELPILFGVGKRSCAGEAYVNVQTFLFIANVVRQFRLEAPKGERNVAYLDGKVEIIAHPRTDK